MKKLVQLLFLLTFGILQQGNAQCQITNVATPDGENTVFTCPQDGIADLVSFSNDNTSGSNYAYAITDETYNILEIVTGNSFDFDPAPAGTCLVWGFSYRGNLTGASGDNVFSTQFSDDCWLISRTAIRVVRDAVDGGMVATPTGEERVYTCLNDGISDFVGFSNTSTSSAKYTYVITDDQNNILGLPPTPYADFSGAPPGDCRVWGLSYTGNLTASVGQNAANIALSDNCFALSSNFITVVRNEVDGGTVAMPSGATQRSLCTQDGGTDIVMFTHNTATSAPYAYVITNEANEILTTTTDSQFDFNPAPAGTCRVWGVSYTGTLTTATGVSVFSTLLSDGCFELSSTAITVYREAVDGGTVAMPSGLTETTTCPGDGNPDVVMFTHQTATPNVNYRYVVTDDQNNILGLPGGAMADFEGAPAGTCRVWGLSYTGNLTAMMGDNAATTALTDGCFELSSNFITVVREMPVGGTVSTASGQTSISVTVGDGINDIIEFAHAGNSAANFTYVVTDDQNNILGIPPGNTQNFEGAPAGVCRVWGLSYTGMITATVGDNAATVALSDGCFELSSNFVTVTRATSIISPTQRFSASYSVQSFDLALSPNPTAGQLALTFNSNTATETMARVAVFSTEGRLVLEKEYATQHGANQFNLDLYDLKNGIYRIVLQNGTQVEQKTFVKAAF